MMPFSEISYRIHVKEPAGTVTDSFAEPVLMTYPEYNSESPIIVGKGSTWIKMGASGFDLGFTL
jgi:hypothetical protein